MARRFLITLAAFWLTGIVAIAIMSDPGSMSNIEDVFGILFLATVGVFFGPWFFVPGVHGLIYGHGSGVPIQWVWVWITLAYMGYVGLFRGAMCFKNWKWRIACIAIEAICALVAAKGVSFCI